MKNLLVGNKFFLMLILILLSVFWIWWIPGPRVGIDFSYIAEDWTKLLFDVPLTWNERGAEGLGEYGVFLLWSWPVSYVFGLLANLGMTFEIWERILISLFIIFGSISIWKFLSLYSLSSKAKLIGSVFYLLNTYSILLIDGGQIFIAISYALFPLACLSVSKAVQSNLTVKILAGLIVALLGFFDIRFIYLLFLLFLFRSIFESCIYRKGNISKILRNWISTGLIIGLIVGGLNSYWLFMQLKFPLNSSIFSSFTQLSTSTINIGHPTLMIAPHWEKNIFGKISLLRAEFISIPVLVFLAPILRRKDKEVLFWVLISLLSIFLGKGVSEPFPNVYSWLHSTIPGFTFFRDSTKFFFLIALSYSLLITITCEELIKKFSIIKKHETFSILLVITYLLYLINPVFLNQMTGTFSIQPHEKEFQSLANVLKGDTTFGRTLWIPSTVPLSYFDLNHPVVEPIRIFNRKPFVFGVKGTYEVFNFLRESPYMGEIFDVAGIAYIAYPSLDIRRDNLNQDNINYYNTFLSQLTNLPWMEKRVEESKVPLLRIKAHQDKVFLPNNTWIAFGSDEIFNEATKSADLKLSKNAIIFAEYKPELGSLISTLSEAKIVLNGKTSTDLVASFIPESEIIFPAGQLTVTPNEKGWWKNDGTNLIAWRSFLQTKYSIDNKEFDLGGGWAVGEGSKILDLKMHGLNENRILFARVLESSRSGEVNFFQGEKLIGTVNTKINSTSQVRWVEVGSMSNSEDLTIKTKGDINIINAIAPISLDRLASYKERSKFLEKRVSYFESQDNLGKAKMSFKKVNPTKYLVTISNLPHTQMLVFSSFFHPLWKLNSQYSVPVYGFLNGFKVDKDGEYILEFEPQRSIGIGLLISGATILVIFSLLIYCHYQPRMSVMK